MTAFPMNLNSINMKKIILLTTLILFNINCSQNKKEMNNKEISFPTIAQDKQIRYIVNATAGIPVIIYFNDIKISEENTPLNTSIDLNPYVLKNGKYKVKIKIFPLFRRGDAEVKPEDIKTCKLFFGNYFKIKETGEIKNFNTDISLPIDVPKNPVPYFEQEWEVEITELPYKLEGWSKGQNLTKMDEKELQSKVVEFYENVKNILNNGEGEKYLKLWQYADKELPSYYYTTQGQYDKLSQNTIEDVEENCKGTMIPLEDYEMKIYGNGKLVTLERKLHTKEFNNYSPLDIKGWSPLISKGKISGAADYPILLYLPEGSKEFVIIRN